MRMDEVTFDVKPIFSGNIFDVERHYVTLPDGRYASRDIVRHRGASVVVPLNDEDEVYMVSQYRKPLEEVTLELPAGKFDEAGEDPRLCAIRELKEETGLTADSVIPLVTIHSTPGFCDEKLHIFLATGLTQGETDPDDDEFVNCEKYALADLVGMVLDGRITDAKTVTGILLTERLVREKNQPV